MNPFLPFEWIVASRFLREGRMQTLFIGVGIAIGVGVIVFMSSLLAGLQANFVRRVLTAQPHIQLLPPKEVARVLGPPPSLSKDARCCCGSASPSIPTARRSSRSRCRRCCSASRS
jgi:ABC-type lipoprotein release transport system permease subunit